MTALPLDDPAPAVAARALTRRYGTGESAVDALRGVSLEVRRPVHRRHGPSGSGKSTLMHLRWPGSISVWTAGTVHIGREEISSMPDRRLTKLRRTHIGFVFQSFNLLPTLTAEENITLPLAIARSKPTRADVDRRLARVGLTERRDQAGRAVGRPAARRDRPRADRAPTVLFADEPTGNLDSAAGVAVLERRGRRGRGGRSDHRHGHARPARRRGRRPRVVPRGRPHHRRYRGADGGPDHRPMHAVQPTDDPGRPQVPERPPSAHRADGAGRRAGRRDGERRQ